MEKLAFVPPTPAKNILTKSGVEPEACQLEIRHLPSRFSKCSPMILRPIDGCTIRSNVRSAADGPSKNSKESKGLFGRMKDAVLRKIVTVPGGGKGGDLISCVFCKGTGFNDCDACKGTGKDSLGTCLMCDGKTYLECTVCRGVGMVDRIRRGGTDDAGEYIVSRKKK